jgi:hypothetical protein
MLIDITEDKADSFLKLIKQHSSIKAKPISTPDAEPLEDQTNKTSTKKCRESKERKNQRSSGRRVA